MTYFKPSNYNHFLYLENEDKYLVYNAISNGLAKLEPEIYRLIKDGQQSFLNLHDSKENADIIKELYRGHILIDNDLDEFEMLHTKFNMTKYFQRVLSLTIVTTLDCNLNCTYCYEGYRGDRYADEDLENKIVDFAADKILSMDYKFLHITWYGGEPLLNKDFIYSLSRKLLALCKSHDVNYGAMIVTNGTLLTRTIVQQLKRYKVGSMQITIDGPQEIHDKRRPLKNPKKSSYQLIVNNIKRIFGLIPIQIRVNVDKTNITKTLPLLDEFEKFGWLARSRDIFVYIGFTKEWTSNCSNITPNCFSMREFSEAEIEFQRLLISKGYNALNLYPNLTSYCVAISPHGFVIDPGGELHKCWSDVGNKDAYFGNVREPIKLNKKLLDWLSFDPLTHLPECKDCRFFPICGGGCPYVPIRQKEKLKNDDVYNCTPWRMFLEEKMKLFMQDKAMKLKQTNKGG